jgi:AcrR family transcriptional regulator
MLRPGPGNRAEEVAQNQRERIFGAMVASVSERGYTATRVADLVALSGVSSRTFYDLFTDKETCFLATIDAVLEIAARFVAKAEAANADRDWEERALSALRAYAEMIVSQKAAARVCLIEAHGAGPEALKRLDEATARFESIAQLVNAESPERVGMPPEMMTAHVGALQEIARNRLRRGTTDELPGLMDEVARVMLSYRPPPQPLRLTTRSPAARPEDLDAHNHAERAMRALAVVVAEKGYAQTPVDEVIARASMSASTFYANFSGKEDALMATIDSAGAQVVAAVVPVFERSPDWASGVRAGFGALFSFLATRPALAHLIAVGVYGAGLPATQRRAKALAAFSSLLLGGGPRRFRPPPITAEVITGAVYGLMYRQVRQCGPESLPALAPICTYLTLAPFIGAEEAGAAANGDGRERGSSPEYQQRLLLAKVAEIVIRRNASARALAREIGVPEEEVRTQIGHLEEAGLVVPIEAGAKGDGTASTEIFYRANTDWIEMSHWEQMGRPQRQAISAQIVRLVTADLDRAVEDGTLDARVDRHLTRLPVELDEQGWRELMAIHHQTFIASLAIQDESAERLQRSGDPGIRGNSVQALFEVSESIFDDRGEDVSDHPGPRREGG